MSADFRIDQSTADGVRGLRAALVMALALGACAATPSAVPSTSLPSQQAVAPTPGVMASPAPLAACLGKDLTVRGRRVGGGTGAAQVVLSFTNVGASTCILTGAPILIALFRPDGSQLPIATRPDAPGALGGAQAVLPPGAPDAANVGYGWSNWCAGAPGLLLVRLTVPAGGAVSGRVDSSAAGSVTPRCDQPTQPSGLELLWGFVSPS